MLERIERIKKVGLFEDYMHSPECEFGKVTLIYGENGVGKSTIAAILDSLREGNASEIVRRRSFPGDVAPTVAITLNGKIYTFDGYNWDDRLPYDTLDVFYPGFVSRNIHAASSIDPEHRRNLCELVLGREAVKSVTRLAEIDTEARAALAKKKQLEEELQLLIKKPDTLETFLTLPNDPNIEEQLEVTRTELKQAQSRDAILARTVPQPVPLPLVDRNAIAVLLEKSADGIGADVGTVVREHVSKCLDANGENWLAYGAKHIKTDEKCPFCSQDITESELVSAIRSYFSAEYQAYTEALSAEIQEIRKYLGAAAFSHIRAAFTSQVALAIQWTDELAIDQSAFYAALAAAEAAWMRGATKLEELVASKQTQPLIKMDPTLAGDALADYQHAKDILHELNNTLSESHKKAEERKAALSRADTSKIEERLHRLENQKARYEPLAQDLLNKRNEQIKKRSALEEEKKALKRVIDDHAAKVVSKYQDGINHYLAYFGCPIRIESVEPGFPSGKASVQYKLKAHGHEIQLGISKEGPCFETVLSEGDKITLALSFFFARLKDYNDLAERVIVLDDPVNSLGSSRRILIEGVIRDLHVRGAQVIVLTHDERLAALIWRDKKLNDIVSLQVERTGKGSRLKSWDVERATQSEYLDDYLTLVDYLENGGDHKVAAGCIRPYVEQRLRYLYPGPPFHTRDSLGQMIGKIRASKLGERLYPLQVKLAELEAINDAALPSHHATDDVPGMTPLSPEEVRLFAQKALDVLG